MIKRNELESAIESLRGEIEAIRTSPSDRNNIVMQALREENISLKTELKYLRLCLKVPI